MNYNFLRISLCLSLFFTIAVQAQLAVTVLPPKIVGQKALVKLAMKNNLADKVESARAMCFLLDDQGRIVGQSTKWVIGQNHTGLEPKSEAIFNFVVNSPQPWTTTNLTAKVSFSRVTLANGKAADVQRDVTVSAAAE